MKAKHLLMMVLMTGSALVAFQAHAGRYDGLTEVFNHAAKHIDPPPPRQLNLDYVAPRFDPPGLRGPDVRAPAPAPPPAPSPTLTQEFNAVAR